MKFSRCRRAVLCFCCPAVLKNETRVDALKSRISREDLMAR